jgi:hypothetical protein
MKKLSEGPGNLSSPGGNAQATRHRTSKQIPRGLLDDADEEEPGLALAASAEDGVDAE